MAPSVDEMGSAGGTTSNLKIDGQSYQLSTPTVTSPSNHNGDTSQYKDKDFKASHGTPGHKTILQSDALYQYILKTSVYPRESTYLKELRKITEGVSLSYMATPPDEVQFLMLLIQILNAKNTMELGVYTGYSLLGTALALPDDGKIVAIDLDRNNYELGAPVIEKAGVAHKVDFREGLILPQLDKMLLNQENLGLFDFIFVDADKDNYLKYHERCLKLVKVGGVIAYDNTLWNGSLVAPEDAPYATYIHQYRPFVLELNKFLAADKRIAISQLSVGDGITLCRRIL
ncbi:hypothetical protein KP509_16G046300 [Ceratopteris richardii]|uniref:Caffeoyl-CoA O-methyltransferase n=1 Tax=Ceratopteris richardii TaxID=49495 RepID=A0A8T2SZZ0_CERRI|nr:hypothetical protein KP509_16G046300 [Ceratopteris richardii]